MSLTINGTTNTLTAASGLAIAGNTAVTGTLSASGDFTSSSAVNAQLNGSDSVAVGANIGIRNTANNRAWLYQLSASNNADWWHYNGSAWTKYMTLSSTGLAVTGTLSTTAQASFSAVANAAKFIASGTSLFTEYYKGTSTLVGYIGNGTGVVTAGGEANFGIRSEASLIFAANGNNKVGEWTSTGLAVTGTLSASGITSVTDVTDATSTTAASLKTAGGLAVAKKMYIGDNIVMASGKGIDFSATSDGSGTMTSEVLSDYEEGTWTPSLGGDTTYTSRVATYTKVGRKVTAMFDMIVNVLGTGSTSVITGLPFTGAAPFGVLSVAYFTGLAVSPVFLTGYGASGSSQIQIAGLTAGAVNISSLAVFGNGTRLVGTITYFV